MVGGYHAGSLIRTLTLLLMLVPVWAPMSVWATDATPSPSEPTFPPASECTSEPFTTENLLYLVEEALYLPWDGVGRIFDDPVITVESTITNPIGDSIWLDGHQWIEKGQITTDEIPPETGLVLDSATLADLVSVLREHSACSNVGTLESQFTFYSPEYIQELVNVIAAEYQMWAVEDWEYLLEELRNSGPGLAWAAPTVEGGIELADGRVLVLAAYGDGGDPDGDRNLVVFRSFGTTWLIDMIVRLVPPVN